MSQFQDNDSKASFTLSRGIADDQNCLLMLKKQKSTLPYSYLLAAIIVSLLIVMVASEAAGKGGHKKMTLEEVLDNAYWPQYYSFWWASDEELLHWDAENADIILFNAKTKTSRILITKKFFETHNSSFHALSPDKKFALIVKNKTDVWRFSSIGSYSILDLESGTLCPLSVNSNRNVSISEETMRYVSWGRRGSQHIMISNNDIYYKDSVHSAPEKVDSVPGIIDVVFNGIPDWVYEEEIIKDDHVAWFSPLGSKLCYASFDDSQVGEAQILEFGSYSQQYSGYKRIRYPKPDTTIPRVSLWVVDLNGPKKMSQQIVPPQDIVNLKEYYLTRVRWLDEDSLLALWLARNQRFGVVSVCRADLNKTKLRTTHWECLTNLAERSEISGGWVEALYNNPVVSPDHQQYALLLPSEQSKAGQDYFQHIALVNVQNGKKSYLTKGFFDVTKIYAFKRDSNELYFETTEADKPGERHVCAVKLSQPTSNVSECLSSDRTECLYSKGTFSPNGTYFVHECLGPNIPYVDIKVTDGNKKIVRLISNSVLKKMLRRIEEPKVRMMSISMNGTYTARVRLFLPPNLNENSSKKRYPLVIEVYGAPRYQSVTQQFPYTAYDWGLYLVSNQSVVYGLIDGRGSSNSGDKFTHETYRRLGSVEVEDQIRIAGYLRDNLKYIRRDEVAILGASYGGYVAAMALAKDKKGKKRVFKCAVSISPATCWQDYNSVYSERYMGRPTKRDNLKGYQDSCLFDKAHRFRDKPFLLIHGTGDDNVHFQHSVKFMKALIKAQVLFSTQIYPDEDHHLVSRMHLLRTVERFLFKECFESPK